MNSLIRLEELGLTAVGVYAYSQTGFAWWLFVVLFLAPDLAMLGYLAGPKVGAFVYNLGHHRGLAVGLTAIGLFGAAPVILAVGSIMLAHSSFDRVFGYGLKYPDSFQHTHLGMIGKAES